MNWDETHNFTIKKLSAKDDYEGKVEATLISRKASEASDKAIFFVHGFVDYFFHDQFADWANTQGFNFYAIDLRKYGRSLLPHHKPNNFKHYNEYFEDFDAAVNQMKKEGNKTLVFYGHSTGGLLTALYAHHKKENVDLLILNSPFFDFNNPPALKKFIPVVAAVGRMFPNLPSPEGLKEGYATSLHKDFKGEWDFSLDWKPIKGFNINLGWVNAIYTAQKELQNGLDIKCPILVMYSAQSVTPGDYYENMHTADAVLNVEHIAKYAKVIGNNVKETVITDGVHDLVLSRKDVRDEVYKVMTEFVKENI